MDERVTVSKWELASLISSFIKVNGSDLVVRTDWGDTFADKTTLFELVDYIFENA